MYKKTIPSKLIIFCGNLTKLYIVEKSPALKIKRKKITANLGNLVDLILKRKAIIKNTSENLRDKKEQFIGKNISDNENIIYEILFIFNTIIKPF